MNGWVTKLSRVLAPICQKVQRTNECHSFYLGYINTCVSDSKVIFYATNFDIKIKAFLGNNFFYLSIKITHVILSKGFALTCIVEIQIFHLIHINITLQMTILD